MPTPAAADYAAIKGIDLENLVRRVLAGIDGKKERQAVREIIGNNAVHLSRLDHDHEVNLNLFSDEFADQMGQLMVLRDELSKRYITEFNRRQLEAERMRARMQIGALIEDIYLDEIEKLINFVVQTDGIKHEDAA